MSDKPPGPGKNYHCQSFILQESLNYSICTTKGKYSILKQIRSLTNLPSTLKIRTPQPHLHSTNFRVQSMEMV